MSKESLSQIAPPGPALSSASVQSLHPEDLICLRRSGLSDFTIERMGIFSISAEEITERLGVKVGEHGYAIPYPGLNDQTGQPYLRVRLRYVQGGQKYRSGRGDDPELYIPAGFDQLPLRELLVITEGEKKAAKAVQEGIACVGTQGVWNWADPSARAVEKHNGLGITSHTGVLRMLAEVARSFKRVLVLGDSDLLTNAQAGAGFLALAASLRTIGVPAYFACCLPAGTEGEHQGDQQAKSAKRGLDDWLMAEKPKVVAVRLALLYRAQQVNYEPLQEARLASEFADSSRSVLAHSPGRGWMIVQGPHWISDDGRNGRLSLVTRYSKGLRTEAEDLLSTARKVQGRRSSRKKSDLSPVEAWAEGLNNAAVTLLNAVDTLGRLTTVNHVLEFAQPHLCVSDQFWDHDPLLLGVQNGIVDLRNGILMPPDPAKFIARCAGTSFDVDATCPQWDAFLRRVLPEAEDREALQRIAGYSVTGLADDQAAFIHYGRGANGKSTFWRSVTAALGDYAVTAGPALVERKADMREQSYEMARLAGARVVTVSETQEDTDLALSVIKRLTGSEMVTARHMYGKQFSFLPTCKLHLSTNHQPWIRDNSHGAWRRLRFVPWSETISGTEMDVKLLSKLQKELPGILLWLVAGATKYLAEGLIESASGRETGEEVRASSDDIQQWIDAEVHVDRSMATQSSQLYRSYRDWAQSSSIPAKSTQVFSGEMQSRGFRKNKNASGCMLWNGIGLRARREDRRPNSDLSERGLQPTKSWTSDERQSR